MNGLKKIKTSDIGIFYQEKDGQIFYTNLDSYIICNMNRIGEEEKTPQYIYFDIYDKEILTGLPLTLKQHGTIQLGLLLESEKHIENSTVEEFSYEYYGYKKSEINNLKKHIRNFENESHLNFEIQDCLTRKRIITR